MNPESRSGESPQGESRLVWLRSYSLSPSYPYSRDARLLNGVTRGALLAPKEVVIKKTVFHFPRFAWLKIARQRRQFLALLFMW